MRNIHIRLCSSAPFDIKCKNKNRALGRIRTPLAIHLPATGPKVGCEGVSFFLLILNYHLPTKMLGDDTICKRELYGHDI